MHFLKTCTVNYSLASRLNGYMYSNRTSLNVALFILMANLDSRITLQLLGVKTIPCRVASLIEIFQLKQKNRGQSKLIMKIKHIV